MKKQIFLFILLALLILAGVGLFFSKKLSRKKSEKALFNPAPTNIPTKSIGPKKVSLAFVGDIGLGREVNWQINQRDDPAFPFQKTAEILRKADLAIGNLEGPLVENCPLTRTGMKFCGDLKNAEGLTFAGFDLVNLANNHISNYGPEGVNQTIKTLQDYQIDYFNSDKIALRTVNGLGLAFLGFDDIVRPVNDDLLVQKIQRAKNQADLVVVNFHWGAEYQSQPTQRQRELARLAIDYGADLIIGHHPHVLQPIEYYQNKPIFYSLGNFVFDQMWSQETRLGAIALITIENHQVKEINIIPTLIFSSCQPEPLPEPQKSLIIEQIFKNQ